VHRPLWLLVLASALIASSGRAGSYDFVVIASSARAPFAGGAVAAFVPPSIDAGGRVAFLATAPGTGSAIFTASQPGSSLDDYVQITGRQGQVSVDVSEIGSFVAGFVAFRASSTVYRGPEAVGPLIPLFGPTVSSGPPAVNALGEVVLVDDLELVRADVQGSEILLQKNDQVAGGTIFDIPFGPPPDINDTSQVAFFADIDFPSGPCDEAFMRSIVGGAEVIALGHDEQCDWDSSGSVPLAINESGSVAYAPFVFDPTNDIGTVFVDSTKVWDDHMPGFGDSPSVEAVALNDDGQVAFQIESGSGFGVYTGSDPLADKVLASGDRLCDATATDIDFQRYGQNDAGQLALYVRLSDGRNLVVRADPSTGPGGQCITVPEPAASLCAAAAALALAAIRRRGRFRPMPRRLRLFAPFLVAVLAPWCVRAGSYHLTVIASTDGGPFHGGPFAELIGFDPPAIDSDGTVAFAARATSQGPALFTGSQADLSIDGYDQLTGLQGQEVVSILSIGSFDAGNVAFSGADAQGMAVFRSAHGLLSPLYRSTTFFRSPAVNGAGVLVVIDGSPLAVLKVDSQGTTTLFQRGDTLAEGNKITGIFGFPQPDIAENGQVAFFALTDAEPCDEAVMRGSALGVAEEVALNSFANPSCDLSEVGSSYGFAINEAGSIGYGAQYFDGADSVEAAYVDLTKVWDAKTPGFPANPVAEEVALNDAGDFALLIAGSDRTGVYSGDDPVADRILVDGDPLCGSTVINLDFQRFGLNDAGQVALWVQLQDGRALIVRAEPGGTGVSCVTEPCTELAAGASVLALTGLRRRAARTARRCPRAA